MCDMYSIAICGVCLSLAYLPSLPPTILFSISIDMFFVGAITSDNFLYMLLHDYTHAHTLGQTGRSLFIADSSRCALKEVREREDEAVNG